MIGQGAGLIDQLACRRIAGQFGLDGRLLALVKLPQSMGRQLSLVELALIRILMIAVHNRTSLGKRVRQGKP